MPNLDDHVLVERPWKAFLDNDLYSVLFDATVVDGWPMTVAFTGSRRESNIDFSRSLNNNCGRRGQWFYALSRDKIDDRLFNR